MIAGQVRDVVQFEPPGGAPVEIHLAHPRRISSHTRLAIVMHGVLRNADEYLDEWTAWAARAGYVVACPRFGRDRWPGGRSYNLGNVFARGRARGELNPEQTWSFTAVEAIADHLAVALGLADRRFDLWGHSAGAQFVHRFSLFRPAAPLRRVIAAGAGWYTLPELDRDFPYGLRHPLLGIAERDARRWVARSLTVMRGTSDTLRDPHLRRTPEADAQGATRYERAARMVAAARALDSATAWRLVEVEGAGHDHVEMARAAQARWAELEPKLAFRPPAAGAAA